MVRKPIVFDFRKGQVYRAKEPRLIDDLLRATKDAANKAMKRGGRIVKTVEGVPPQQVQQPKS